MKRPVVLLLVAAVFLSAAVIYLGWRAGVFGRACRVRLISDSKVLRARVEDEVKFRAFVEKFAPCESGSFRFRPAHENRGDGLFKAKELTIVFTDERFGEGLFDRSYGEAGRKGLASWKAETDQSGERAALFLQFSPEFFEREDYAGRATFILAARVLAMTGLGEAAMRTDAPVKSRIGNFALDPSVTGVSYERL